MIEPEFEEFRTELFLLAAKPDGLADLKKCIQEYYVQIGIPIVEVNHPFIARARYNENGEVFKTKQQVSYNPFIDKIDLQRANYKGQQVFYGAIPSFKGGNFCSLTALLESGMQYVKDENTKRETFTLTRWTINRPLRVVILPFSRKSIERNKHFADAATIQNQIIRENFSSQPEDDSRKHIEALEFISDCFCETNNKEMFYRITATYCDVVTKFLEYNKMFFDGFVYPSANTEADGVNIVLRKELADDDTLTFDYVVMNIMQRAPNNPKEISFLRGSEDVYPDANGNFSIQHIY